EINEILADRRRLSVDTLLFAAVVLGILADRREDALTFWNESKRRRPFARSEHNASAKHPLTRRRTHRLICARHDGHSSLRRRSLSQKGTRDARSHARTRSQITSRR